MSTTAPATQTVRGAVAARENQPAQVSPREALRILVEKNAPAIAASLPGAFDPARFQRLLLTAANTNPKLFECDRLSFLAAGIQAAQLGLEPNDARGLAYLRPIRIKGQMQVQFIPGYRGLMDLARRSGMVTTIYAEVVYADDFFRYTKGLDPTLEHVPADDGDEDPAKITHAYAVAKVAGDPQFVVVTRKGIEKARAKSDGATSEYSPWNTSYDEMAKKTAIRRLCKMLPQSAEVAQALESDGRSFSLGDLGHVTAVPDDDTVEATARELPAGVDPETGEVQVP